jgi:hypothetical protein
MMITWGFIFFINCKFKVKQLFLPKKKGSTGHLLQFWVTYSPWVWTYILVGREKRNAERERGPQTSRQWG